MSLPVCPKCGRNAATDAVTCPACGEEMKNGAVPSAGNAAAKPPVPPQASGWVISATPPEVITRARQTFNEEEFLAGLEEIRQTGGLQFEDFVKDLEQAAGEHG